MTSPEALKKYFGYDSFRPGQEEIINAILMGENVMAVLPTGAGKSMCYQIPALISDSYSIVISPLIALMKDQVDSVNTVYNAAAFINSNLDYNDTKKVLNNLRDGKLKLLYVAPERLHNNIFLETIESFPPEYLFIDEAHCISEWGHNFRPSYRKIKEFVQHFKIEKISAFTATATPEVREDIKKQLFTGRTIEVVKGFERDNLSISVLKTREKKNQVLTAVKKFGTPAIVYTATRAQTEELDSFLKIHDQKSAHYHAGLSTGLRTIIQDDFISGRTDIIVATNAFGMGIDKKDIRTIVHNNLPPSLENYYQEIGRAGRDGKESKTILLYEPKDKFLQEFLIDCSHPTRDQIEMIYTLLYDYAQIALGTKSDNIVELKEQFYIVLSQRNVNELITKSVLRILEENEIIEIVSEINQSHFFKFAINSDQLKSYVKQIARSSLKELIIALLKVYGASAFVQRVRIDQGKLKPLLSESFNSVSNELLTLSEIGIIDYEPPTSNTRIRFLKTRVPLKNLGLDNKHEIVRENALKKLETVIDFIETDMPCRFRYILEYFGEKQNNYLCGKCDLCTNEITELSGTIEFIEEIILETLREARNPLSIKDVVNTLKGISPSGKLRHFSRFGSCEHFKNDEITTSIETLINKGYLTEIERRLSLTDKAIEKSITEEIPLQEGPLETPEQNDSLELFHILKGVRKELARKFSQQPEVICNDQKLRLISEKKPTSPSELMSIEGITQKLFNKIGDEFIDAIKEFNKVNESRKTPPANTLPENLETIKSLVNKGYSLEEISSLMKLSDHLIAVQIESLIKFSPETPIDKLIPKNEIKIITDEINNGKSSLKDIKEGLSENISYSKIRIILTKIQSS